MKQLDLLTEEPQPKAKKPGRLIYMPRHPVKTYGPDAVLKAGDLVHLVHWTGKTRPATFVKAHGAWWEVSVDSMVGLRYGSVNTGFVDDSKRLWQLEESARKAARRVAKGRTACT